MFAFSISLNENILMLKSQHPFTYIINLNAKYIIKIYYNIVIIIILRYPGGCCPGYKKDYVTGNCTGIGTS